MATFSRAVVVIPTLNEVETVLPVIDAMLQDPAADFVFVIDGGSTDGTWAKVDGYLPTSPRLRLLRNDQKTQAYAMNLAAGLAADMGADMLVRVDAHARYPDLFVSKLKLALEHSEAASVVVPLVAHADASHSSWRQACAALQCSWLGTGGARHRKAGPSGWVTHGHHAAFDLSVFLELDGYDTAFSACEDVDYDMRLAERGYQIWMAGGLPLQYLPRATPLSYFKQMFRNGRGRAACASKHQSTLSLRQLLPLGASVSVLLSLVLAVFWYPIFALICAAYMLAVFGLAVAVSQNSGLLNSLRVSWLACLAHLGFSCGLVREWLNPRSNAETLSP